MSLDMERLLDAIRQTESGGNPEAVSPKGALGPYQFMPATAREFGVTDPKNEKMARAGAREKIGGLLKYYKGDVNKALAAWNWGEGNLDRNGMDQMPEETRGFLSKVMNHYYNGVTRTPATPEADLFKTRQAPADALFPGNSYQSRRAAGALFPNNGDESLRRSVLDPLPTDKASRIYRLQLRTGLPSALIENNLDQIERQTKGADFNAEAFRAKSPLLAKWLASNTARASTAQGDYESLSALEKAWQTMQAIPAGVEQGLNEKRLMDLGYKAVVGTLTPQEAVERKRLQSEVQLQNERFAEGIPNWVKSAADIFGLQLPMAAEAAQKGATIGLPLGAGAGAALGAIGGPGAPVTVPAGAVAGGIAGFKTAAGASYIEQTYRLSVGEAYDDLEGAKDAAGNHIDPTAARYAALLVGVPNALMEFASLRQAVKVIPGAEKVIGKLSSNAMKEVLMRPTVMAALKDFGKKYAVAVGTEGFTEGMQKLLVILSREVATGDMGSGISQQDVKDIGAEAAAAAKGSAVLGLLPAGPKVIELHRDMQKAQKNVEFMQGLGEIVGQSKTQAASPEAMQDFISTLKRDSPVKDVFIPIDAWNGLFQSEAPTAAKEVFGNLNAYTEAATTGGDIVIPIELYASKLAATPFHQQLIQDMRLAPGEMTMREAADIEAMMPEFSKHLEEETNAQLAKEEPLSRVYNDVRQKLRDVGMGDVEANRDALLWKEHLRARAERLNVDPWKLYQEQPLTVQRSMPGKIPPGLETYNQQLAEPAVPNSQRLPLAGGESRLPTATTVERKAAAEALKAARQSEKDFGVFGATIHPDKGNQSGVAGVAVAGYPQRGVVTEGAPTQRDLETFLRRNRDIFKADKNAALGVWVDSETGKGYLDITNVLPRDKAIAQGEYLGELAVWDLEHGEEIRLGQKAAAGQGVLFQGERGASVPLKGLIALLQKADPSTFVHETGHLWLEELGRDAQRPEAPEQLKKDWETIKEWTGATDNEISVEAHEKFARGVEAYVMEGKAPSFQLREAFAQFKDWMVRIYKSMVMLDVQLTPEVVEVMDRLMATDEAIKQVRERNTYNIPLLDESMMTADEYAAYQKLNEEAKLHAEETFRVKVMKELRREKLATWRQQRDAMVKTVRDDILEIPIYKVAHWLWSDKLPDGTVIEGLASTKLDKQALIAMGVDPAALPFRVKENGLHPDVVAELFGFPSGETLVHELIGLPKLKDAIDEEVSARMRQEHGDLLLDGTFEEQAAMEVQNTQQIDVFNMEMRILKRMGAKRETTHPAIMKDLARQIISRKTLREIDPAVFEAAALKAAKDADDALLGREFRMGTGRNLEAAFDAKQRQMLNVFLYREAFEKRQEADKHIKKWNKFLFRSDERLAKNYNMDMVNAARAIAATHGIGKTPEMASEYMKALAEYDPQSYEDLKDIVEMASSDGRDVQDLTISEFGIMRDAIEGLWQMARRSKQIEIDGVKMDRNIAIGEMALRVFDLVDPKAKQAGYERAMTSWDKTKMGFLGGKAMTRRVEHWVDAMDNGDRNGVFRRYIWNPISEAADQYRDRRRIALEKYLAISKAIPKSVFHPGKIDAAEIGYEFANKTELLGALLHTGNESNLSKLLRGRNWGVVVDGELDSSHWDAFIERLQRDGILTKDDYDFVQSVWDLMDELKPDAQKAHKEMYGYYFDEVTARPINTPFGLYKGGYYPATVDPFMVEDAAIRAERDTLESRPSSFMFPTTGRGFTRSRVEGYARPLSLDLGMIPNHLEKVLRFTYLEPHVKDIGRVMIDKDFRAVLSRLDTEVASVMLMPWLQRSALQMVEQPSGPRMRMFDQFFHAIRTRTGLQMMAVNVSVAFQQVLGLSLSATQVKPRYLAGALWRYTSSPRLYASQISESSAFMRNRVTTQAMDIRSAIDKITLNPSKFERAKDFAIRHSYFMQTGLQNVVDIITWGGAYEQATANGATEKEAVRAADSAVRETQGSFSPEDISRFEAGKPFTRMFTMFTSYFNMAANLNATEMVKAARRGGFAAGGRAFYVYLMGFMIPAILSEAITQAMSGAAFDDSDDDGYLDNILSIFFGGQARMATAMVPVIGPVAQMGINAFNDKWYDDRISTSPVMSALEASARVPYDLFKLATDEEANMKRPIQDLLTLTGMATGLPVAPLSRPIGYAVEMEQGNVEPKNAADMARGFISGKAPQ